MQWDRSSRPTPRRPRLFGETVALLERRRGADDVPARPLGLRFAAPADCDSIADVRAAGGGSVAACRDRLTSGGAIVTWTQYADLDCTEAILGTIRRSRCTSIIRTRASRSRRLGRRRSSGLGSAAVSEEPLARLACLRRLFHSAARCDRHRETGDVRVRYGGRTRRRLFGQLWHPSHWYYKNPDTARFSNTSGANDGRFVDGVDSYGSPTLAGGHASIDLTGNVAFAKGGHLPVAHPTLHEGKYLVARDSIACAAINPHIDLVAVRTQTTAAPVIIQPIDTMNESAYPILLATPTPKLHV